MSRTPEYPLGKRKMPLDTIIEEDRDPSCRQPATSVGRRSLAAAAGSSSASASDPSPSDWSPFKVPAVPPLRRASNRRVSAIAPFRVYPDSVPDVPPPPYRMPRNRAPPAVGAAEPGFAAPGIAVPPRFPAPRAAAGQDPARPRGPPPSYITALLSLDRERRERAGQQTRVRW